MINCTSSFYLRVKYLKRNSVVVQCIISSNLLPMAYNIYCDIIINKNHQRDTKNNTGESLGKTEVH